MIFPQAQVILADFGYPVQTLWLYYSQTLELFSFLIFRYWVIPETLCAHKFDMYSLITINGSLPQLVPKGSIHPVFSVIIIKTKVLVTQAWVTLSDFIYFVQAFCFIAPNKLIDFPIFLECAYLIKVIFEMRRAH